MLCDQCHERDAVLNLTQIVENAVTQLHLCEKCAAERGIETTVSMPKHPLGDFLDAVQQQALMHPSDSSRCSFCGTSLKDFRASGRLGCAQCYGAFEQSLKDLLRRVHGSAQHVGRVYAVPNPELLERDVSLGALRAQLQKAIENEEFETAARLRDEIRTLEGVSAMSRR
ncbi:MAG TPA: UvrB/UvrC motif-containing protein [Gemmatimonadaceae bacterium]|jgi:protein arginine kinase activator|nr:UvrB/UvrC motif-containing protein [Gemmatimonadaceae bacterium]